MFRNNYVEILIFILVILVLSIAPSKSAMFGSCDVKFMDYENNIYYFKLKVARDFAGDLPWVYTAEKGGIDECKKLFRSNEREIMKVMKGAGPAWSSHSNLQRVNIKKSEFCKSNGPFSLYGLGESALRYCGSNKSSLISLSKYSLCKESLNIGLNNWIETNNYVQESWNRGLSVEECRRTVMIEEGLSSDLVIESNNDTSPANNAKNKLIELKNLLSEGLITQDQYDKKSNEILDSL